MRAICSRTDVGTGRWRLRLHGRPSVSKRGWAWTDVAALGILAVASVWFVALRWSEARAERSNWSYDTYNVDYPIAAYLAQALHQGYGLLWNRFQNSGEPFYASTTVGAFYPPHALSLLVGFDVALLVVMWGSPRFRTA